MLPEEWAFFIPVLAHTQDSPCLSLIMEFFKL